MSTVAPSSSRSSSSSSSSSSSNTRRSAPTSSPSNTATSATRSTSRPSSTPSFSTRGGESFTRTTTDSGGPAQHSFDVGSLSDYLSSPHERQRTQLDRTSQAAERNQPTGQAWLDAAARLRGNPPNGGSEYLASAHERERTNLSETSGAAERNRNPQGQSDTPGQSAMAGAVAGAAAGAALGATGGQTTNNPTGQANNNPPAQTTNNPTGQTNNNPTGQANNNPAGQTNNNPPARTTNNPTGQTTNNPTGQANPQGAAQTPQAPAGQTVRTPAGNWTVNGNQVTDPQGVQWNRQPDGSWTNGNGQTRHMQFGQNRVDIMEGNHLTQYDLRNQTTTEWDWDRGQGMWSRPGENGATTHMLPRDGSTITHDRNGRVTGFTGHGAIQNEIRNISQMRNPQLRNLRITQMYEDLSRIMGGMMPHGGANWSTFAAWASRQAGVTMRGEDSGLAVGAVNFGSGVMSGLTFGQVDPAQWIRQNAAARVGEGNNQVFSEIAPQLARFISTFQGQTAPDNARLQEYLRGFNGPDQEFNRYMRTAFTHYHNAMFAPRDQQRDLVRQGNENIAWIEQSHLQNTIARAIPYGMQRIATQTMMGLNIPMVGGRQTISLADAGDWADLNQRYDFIRNFMSQQQMNHLLFDRVFSNATLQAMLRGQVPAGAP